MPCETPFRDDSEQRLLFKIASCINDGSFIAGVASFNGRSGVVTLTAADIATALGCTPACEADTISQADGDARYVLKSGDSMSGALSIDNGSQVASAPYLSLSQTWNNAATTFTGLLSNVTNTASGTNSNLFNFQVDGSDRFNFTVGGTLRAIYQAATDTAMTFFLRKRGNAGSATGAVASDAPIGSIAYSGWDGTAFATGSHIDGIAAEAWTNVAHGSRINFYTTPVGSITEQISLRLDSNGQARFLDGTAALPALTFQTDPDTGIYRIGANSFGSSAGGSVILATSTTGINLTTALAYQYNGSNVIRAQTALNNYFFAPSGNLTMTGANNFSFGAGAFLANTTGANNIAVGVNSLASNLVGNQNVAIGGSALRFSDGSGNVAIGVTALNLNTSGSNNTAVGLDALGSQTIADSNSAFGRLALFDITSGGMNTAVGHNTGRGITTGSSNTIIGASVTGLAAGLSNNIILADGAGVIRLQINSSGNTTLAGTVQTAAGTAALPAFSFTADPNTGIYNIGADSVGLSTGGTLRTTTNTTDLILATAFRLAMASGANQRAGNLTLIGGTLTVANTSVTANTIILLTRKTAGGTIGFSVTYTVIAATSFTVTSDNALDTSTYSYILVEVP